MFNNKNSFLCRSSPSANDKSISAASCKKFHSHLPKHNTFTPESESKTRVKVRGSSASHEIWLSESVPLCKDTWGHQSSNRQMLYDYMHESHTYKLIHINKQVHTQLLWKQQTQDSIKRWLSLAIKCYQADQHPPPPLQRMPERIRRATLGLHWNHMSTKHQPTTTDVQRNKEFLWVFQ